MSLLTDVELGQIRRVRALGLALLVSGKMEVTHRGFGVPVAVPRQAEKRFPREPPIFSLRRTLIRCVGSPSSKQGETQ